MTDPILAQLGITRLTQRQRMNVLVFFAFQGIAFNRLIAAADLFAHNKIVGKNHGAEARRKCDPAIVGIRSGQRCV